MHACKRRYKITARLYIYHVTGSTSHSSAWGHGVPCEIPGHTYFQYYGHNALCGTGYWGALDEVLTVELARIVLATYSTRLCDALSYTMFLVARAILHVDSSERSELVSYQQATGHKPACFAYNTALLYTLNALHEQ